MDNSASAFDSQSTTIIEIEARQHCRCLLTRRCGSQQRELCRNAYWIQEEREGIEVEEDSIQTMSKSKSLLEISDRVNESSWNEANHV